MEEKKFNVQKSCEEIHAQYGTSETANYHILLMCDKIENRAFEAGRKSVIENLPKLKWKERFFGDEYFLEACPFGAYYLIKIDYRFHVAINYKHLVSCTSLFKAKRAANEDYKQRIKKVLGL